MIHTKQELIEIVAERVKHQRWDGEDDWFALSHHQDLNIFINMDGEIAASVYDVVEGCTITDYWIEIPIERCICLECQA